MKYHIRVRDGVPRKPRVLERAFAVLDLAAEMTAIGPHAFRLVIHNDHPGAPVQEFVANKGADEAEATGDDDGLFPIAEYHELWILIMLRNLERQRGRGPVLL